MFLEADRSARNACSAVGEIHISMIETAHIIFEQTDHPTTNPDHLYHELPF